MPVSCGEHQPEGSPAWGCGGSRVLEVGRKGRGGWGFPKAPKSGCLWLCCSTGFRKGVSGALRFETHLVHLLFSALFLCVCP